MTLFVASVVFVLVVSALCSLTEAALYAVNMTYVRQLAESGSRAGRLLMNFKQQMERPITAILILNTTANTAGAAIAGAQARTLFGEAAMVWFAAGFTLMVLFCSEIMPKVAGVAYNRTIIRMLAVPLQCAIVVLSPLVWVSQRAARLLHRGEQSPLASEDEVRQMAAMSEEEGSILPIEARLIRNVLQLDEIRVRQIMTPRPVVYRLPAHATVREVAEQVIRSPHARIPVHEADNTDVWIGLVYRNEILTRMARDEFDVTLKSLAKPLSFVPEFMPGHLLLNEFLTRREHLLVVIDEYGDMTGVVTLEDLIEAILGEEIVDETDTFVDLRELARLRSFRRSRNMPQHTEPPQPKNHNNRSSST